MQCIYCGCINQGRQTPLTATPPSASSPLFVLSAPSPPSPFPLLMLIILSVLPPSPGIDHVCLLPLLPFTHCCMQTHSTFVFHCFVRGVPPRLLTVLQTGSLSRPLSGLKIAPPPPRVCLHRFTLGLNWCCCCINKSRYTCAPLCPHVHLHRSVFNVRRACEK